MHVHIKLYVTVIDSVNCTVLSLFFLLILCSVSYKGLYPIWALYLVQERLMESLAFLYETLCILHYPFLLFDSFKQPNDSMILTVSQFWYCRMGWGSHTSGLRSRLRRRRLKVLIYQCMGRPKWCRLRPQFN